MAQLNKATSDKFLSTLALTSTDTREDSLKSIIVGTLDECDETVTTSELIAYIDVLFDVKPYEEEVQKMIDLLHQELDIDVEDTKSGKKYALSETGRKKVSQIKAEQNTNDQQRFRSFKSFLEDNFDEDFSTIERKDLWIAFKEYIYHSFYHYGEQAAKFLSPDPSYQRPDDSGHFNAVNKALSKLRYKELGKHLKKIIDEFPDKATPDDIAFLSDLANRTLAFTSLGIDASIVEEVYKEPIVDWVLYLDTNVLFSILGLHSHPEDQACKELIKLILENQNLFNLELRYSNISKKELMDKKSDFTDLDSELSQSAIKAILQSEELDPYHRKFYQELLKDPDTVLHPNDIIDQAGTVLPQKGIKISQDKAQIEAFDDAYVDSLSADFDRYLGVKNEAIRDFNHANGTKINEKSKSRSQLRHDVILRDLIHQKRSKPPYNSTPKTFNSVKYFGLTLDNLLLEFDKIKSSKESSDKEIPIFLKPSLLLNKLQRLLPIQSDDYQRAFVKAISSRSFNSNVSRSKDVIKIASYLRSQGVDSERLIVELISDGIFLGKYSKESKGQNFDQDTFIKSELGVKFDELTRKVEATEEKLQNTTDKLNEKDEEIGLVKLELDELNRQRKILEKGMESISKEQEKKEEELRKYIQDTQPKLDFTGAENEKLKRELNEKEESIRKKEEEKNQARNAYKEAEFKKWKRRNIAWSWILIIIPILLAMLAICIDGEKTGLNSLFDSELQKWGMGLFATIIILIFEIFGINKIHSTSKATSDNEAFLKSLKFPDYLN